MCTGMIARVRGVIAASTASGSRLKVRSSISANTGLARWNSTTLAEAMNENDEVITSSPGPIPSCAIQACRPAVPLEQATAWRVPATSANASSNRRIIGPSARLPDRSTSSTSSSSRPSRYGRASGIWRTATTSARPWSPGSRPHRCRHGILEELGEALVAALHGGEEHLLDLARDRAAAADVLAVDRRDRRHLGGRAAQERLVGEVEVGANQRRLAHLVTERAGDPDHAVSGDAGQAGVAGRRRVE